MQETQVLFVFSLFAIGGSLAYSWFQRRYKEIAEHRLKKAEKALETERDFRQSVAKLVCNELTELGIRKLFCAFHYEEGFHLVRSCEESWLTPVKVNDQDWPDFMLRLTMQTFQLDEERARDVMGFVENSFFDKSSPEQPASLEGVTGWAIFPQGQDLLLTFDLGAIIRKRADEKGIRNLVR